MDEFGRNNSQPTDYSEKEEVKTEEGVEINEVTSDEAGQPSLTTLYDETEEKEINSEDTESHNEFEDLLEDETIEEVPQPSSMDETERESYNDNPFQNDYSYYEPRPQKVKNKGLRVFCIILSLVIVATLSACAGYILGKNKQGSSSNKQNAPEVELEGRPDSSQAHNNYIEVYNEVTKSIVSILVYSDAEGTAGAASGIIYSKDGYIVTNDHIYASVPNAKFLVRLHNGEEYKASYVAGDVRSDLAVLKLDSTVKDLVPATLGNSAEAFVGEEVVAIGHPSSYGDEAALTHGILSSVNKRVSSSTTNYASTFLQTDATINPGNSGGALCNMYGQVIGVTSAKLAGDEYDAVSFAIPTVTVKKVVTGLINDGCVKDRAKLGITYTEVNKLASEANNIPRGILIASISEESDLSSKGFSEGDIITHVNGSEILKSEILLTIIESNKAGDKIDLTIYNSKKKVSQTVSVTLLSDKGTSSYSTKDTTIVDDGNILDIPESEKDKNEDNNKIFDFPLD